MGELDGQMTVEECVAEAERAEAFKEKLAHWRRDGVPVLLPDSFRAVKR